MIEKEKILDRTDPVCGLKVNMEKTQYTSRVGDDIYYFCSEECKKRFDFDPRKYSGDDDQDD